MIKDELMQQMKDAMKAGDKVRLAAVRYMISEIKSAEIDARTAIDDNAVIDILKKEVKKRRDGIEQLKEAGRDVAEEEAKLAVIEEFMPEMMSREEVEKVVDEVIGGGASDFGAVMGQVMGKLKGQADGKTVQEVVKEKLG